MSKFDLYLTAGDYVYEVIIDDGSTNRITVVQDKFLIKDALYDVDLSITVAPTTYTFLYNDISTNLVVTNTEGVTLSISTPSWMDSSALVNGYKLTVTDFSTAIPYKALNRLFLTE